MKKLVRVAGLTSVFILILLFVSSCSSTPSINSSFNNTPAETKDTPVNQILNQYFEELLPLFPLYATAIGDHRYDAQLTISPSPEQRKLREALALRTFRELKKLNYKEMDAEDQLTWEVAISNLTNERDLLQTDLDYLMPFNQYDSFFTEFAEISTGSSYVTFNSLQDYRNFMKRALVLPEYFDMQIKNMRDGMKRGITTPRILVDQALKQIHALTPTRIEDSVFYKPLLLLDRFSENERIPLKNEYESLIIHTIYPAYQKLENFIRQEYRFHARLTHGVSALPGGNAYYSALVKMHTTTDLTPDDIMSLGYAEVRRIEKELIEIKDEINFHGSLKEFYRFLNQPNPKLYPFRTSEEVLNAYESIHSKVNENIPSRFRLMPKTKFKIQEIEKFLADNAIEFYQNGSNGNGGSRPENFLGIFWVPIPNPEKYSFKDMETLFLHEAIPGHHFQISIQQELDLSRYRRFKRNNAFIEGWGLYCESLGKDLGLYTDSYSWIGRLQNEMHRAIRLVVDTGIHSQGWSREKAIQYSVDHEPASLQSITAEVERYMADPGQALSYKIGELKIQELKKLAQEKLRLKYNDRDFHDQILKDGALPLSVLEAKIKRWIDANTL